MHTCNTLRYGNSAGHPSRHRLHATQGSPDRNFLVGTVGQYGHGCCPPTPSRAGTPCSGPALVRVAAPRQGPRRCKRGCRGQPSELPPPPQVQAVWATATGTETPTQRPLGGELRTEQRSSRSCIGINRPNGGCSSWGVENRMVGLHWKTSKDRPSKKVRPSVQIIGLLFCRNSKIVPQNHSKPLFNISPTFQLFPKRNLAKHRNYIIFHRHSRGGQWLTNMEGGRGALRATASKCP